VVVADSGGQQLLKERVGHVSRPFLCRNREAHALIDFRQLEIQEGAALLADQSPSDRL